MKKRRLHREFKKVWVVLLAAAVLIIMQLPVTEADAATSASDFVVEGNTLVKYRGTEKSVSIPDDVEVIGESAFEGDTNIELVVVPNSVKRIESYAFWGCDNLETVVLGRGLQEVGDYAFANCTGLNRMTIPENVRSIGIQAFANCVNMENITIGPGVTSIHETAFDGCSRLTIHCDEGTVADEYAQDFYVRQKEMPGYGETPEDTPDSGNTENGGQEAATGSPDTQDSNTEENTGSSGNVIGSTHVVGNQAVFFINGSVPTVLVGEAQNGTAQETASIENQSAGNQAQGSPSQQLMAVGSENPNTLPKYTIVDGRIVADQAYYRNQSLGSVSLPEGITEIGQFAFARSSISGISIPDGVKNICYGAFYHCDDLTEVSLPETVTLVEPKAFAYSAWVENFLQNGDSDFLISGGVLVAYRGNASTVEIPEGVRVIAGEAFMQHDEIKSVSFPDSLVSIGEGAFEGCSGLAEVSFGASPTVTDIKDRAFAGCRLIGITLPASVERLGIGAFDEAVQIEYQGGNAPESTYEASAQRLSNEDYRRLAEENTESPGVTVTGAEGASASLEGASRTYTLSVQRADGNSSSYAVLQRAYERSFGAALPENTVVYDLSLYDNSGIPLTKLGAQALTVTLPVPDGISGNGIQIYTTDRNGQLESVKTETVSADAGETIRFTVNQVGSIGICQAVE